MFDLAKLPGPVKLLTAAVALVDGLVEAAAVESEALTPPGIVALGVDL